MKRSYLIAGLLAVAVTGWVLSGQFGSSDRPAEAQKPPAKLEATTKLTQVRVRRQQSDVFVAETVLRGRTEALRSVDIKSETHGRVVELAFERGDRLKEGQVILRLAPESRPERLTEAKALLEQRRIEYKASKRLKEKGFRAQTQLSAALANLESAQAEVRRAQVELDNTAIRAPFEAVADDRMVDLGDFVETGNPVARIVDLDPILVVAEVNEQHVGKIKVDTIGDAKLITGVEVAGRVRFVASMANAATRTFRVEMEVPNPEGTIPDGVSAELRLPLGERSAHKVSPAILTLSDSGQVGVMTLVEGNKIAFQPAEVLDSSLNGVWLGGLPDEVVFVTVGQEFVSDGQEVEAFDEETLQPFGAAATS